MLRVSWSEKITNVEIFNKLKKNAELFNTIKKRKLTYFGNIIRGEKYEVLRLIIKKKITGKLSVGRR